MQTPLLATLIASTLLVVSLAGLGFATLQAENGSPLSVFGNDPANGAGADETRLEHGPAGDAHGRTGMERPAFPVGEGSVPTASDAEDLEEVSSLRIIGDAAAVPSNGVRSGSGTLEDPYVITGYYVTGDLYLGDTDACYLIKENYVAGQLTLNWNGQCVHVHHNYIGDLRVNENIRREGYATGGLLEANKIAFIGQLRHYDGEFRHNVVGPRPADAPFDKILETTPLLAPDILLANVDGFNQGLIHHNTFYGPVDLDLHGHHHGTGFFAPHSHYHGDNETRMMPHDHTDRWTSVFFTDNKIVDDTGYGLRYEDRNHAGDDRTANSEQVEELNEDHTHHTHIAIERNVIEGGQIWVDIFNADDAHHDTRNPGWLDINDNHVIVKERSPEERGVLDTNGVYDLREAVRIGTVKELQLNLTGNILEWRPYEDDGSFGLDDAPLADRFLYPQGATPAAIRIVGVRDGDLRINGNHGLGFTQGVYAHNFDDLTVWETLGNTFDGAQQDVYYDETVPNGPRTE